MNYQDLKTLIDSEPSNDGKTPEEVADWCNDPAGVSYDRDSITAREFHETLASYPSEYAALTDAERDFVALVGQNDIPTTAGNPIRTALVSILGTSTKADLAALIPSTKSRAENAGLRAVSADHVAHARTL